MGISLTGGLGCVSVSLCLHFLSGWTCSWYLCIRGIQSTQASFPLLSCRPEASPGRSCPEPSESHRVPHGEVWGYMEHWFRTFELHTKRSLQV